MYSIKQAGWFFLFTGLAINSLFAQGSLTPTAAPGATMKSLDQIEARTDIRRLSGDGTCIYAITNPGSYYLTGTISVSNVALNGINISADDVTIDMGGFGLVATNEYYSAITVTGAHRNIAIKNGAIDGWNMALDLAESAGSSGFYIDRMRVSGGNYGIQVPKGSAVTECVVNNSYTAFNGQAGCAFRGCVAASGGTGFYASDNCMFINCLSTTNGDGFEIGNNCLIKDCSATGGTYGLYGSYGNRVSDSIFNNNYQGIQLAGGNIVKNCTIENNSSEGIEASGDNLIEDNLVFNNYPAGGDGIYVFGAGNQVAGNLCVSNYTGVRLYTSNSVVIHNVLAMNTTPFSFFIYPVFYGNPIKTNDLLSRVDVISSNAYANFEFK